MKKVLSIIVMVLLLCYVGVALVAFSPRPADQPCTGIELKGAYGQSQFETPEEVLALLQRFHLDPVGKPMSQVSCSAIEDSLRTLSLVLRCECYKTVGSKVGVNITCRKPILRVIPENGKSYYIDRDGVPFDRLPKAVYLPVATGHIDKAFAQKELFEMACFLQKDDFWNAQIEQINVNASHELELVPRVGSQIIRFGKVEKVKYKFDKLAAFYDKGVSHVGWQRYRAIDISYGDQVIGIK